MAIGLVHVKSRKIEKTSHAEPIVVAPPSPIQTQDKILPKKMKAARRNNVNTVDFEEPESTWMNWSSGRVTAAPISGAMATLQRLCALENQLLGWAESQITTRLHTQK